MGRGCRRKKQANIQYPNPRNKERVNCLCRHGRQALSLITRESRHAVARYRREAGCVPPGGRRASAAEENSMTDGLPVPKAFCVAVALHATPKRVAQRRGYGRGRDGRAPRGGGRLALRSRFGEAWAPAAGARNRQISNIQQGISNVQVLRLTSQEFRRISNIQIKKREKDSKAEFRISQTWGLLPSKSLSGSVSISIFPAPNSKPNPKNF